MPGPGIKNPHPQDLLGAWQSACLSVGLGRPNEHGLDIRDGTEAANYVGKWGLDLEMTKAHVKTGREGHRTPWDLLRDFEQTGDLESGTLFKQFASAFTGKRQLVFSRGLRADLCMQPERTDREIAEEEEDDAILLGSLTDSEWNLILWRRARGQVLEAARYGGWSAVRNLIHSLRQRAP